VKWLIWIVVLGCVAAAGWFGWTYYDKNHNKPPEYRTAEVSRGDLVQSVTASGQLNPVLNVQVGSQISGIIQQLYADFNSTVTQAQVIAELDPATYLAALHQAEAEVANAKAALELTQLNAKRSTELRKTELIAVSENDKAVADLHQAEAQVLLRQAALEKARVDLSRCTVYAPTNGVVISRNVDVGQTVAASLSAPTLFVIANDLSKMQIDALVSEADIGGVEADQPVKFTVEAFPTRNFSGKVVQIRNAPSTNQNVVSYDTVVAVENRDLKLKPGMTATVAIITAQHEDALKIPNAALRFKPPEPATRKTNAPPATAQGQGQREPGQPRAGGSGGWGGSGGGGGGPGGPRQGGGGAGRAGRPPSTTRTVYVLASDNPNASAPQVKPRQIKIGISDGISTEVVDGLKEGEIVVIGSNAPQPTPPPGGGAANPFGGGGRRF
jgi:HlyD family secretion protein